MLTLHLVNDQVVVQDVAQIKRLRELGICGLLIGTLAKYPQQNTYLLIPLLLSQYESMWLYRNTPCQLVTYPVDSRQKLLESSKSSTSDGEFIVIPELAQTEYIMKDLPALWNYNDIRYKVYSQLKENGWYLMSGFRFGGLFVAYPGDPLRFHSHLVVLPPTPEIELISLIRGGRLASGVKKVWILVDANEDNTKEDTCMFSIEWAGFG
ncbi:tRNA-splicing endonuclease subunit [Scheffersomyces spartinae]|uniref:tRNA-intron lyase n=1 Tax=Scheffersomyces spartinae TaxID=45513 RepID=A0A9P7V945_9ASCO|nr:tRNA-splicing endonuclease subunit [Scheffersomyces spartinae]KAG7193117.1 tRNA-splicing endonuclease subunit [Scheffersomyces spartinae]